MEQFVEQKSVEQQQLVVFHLAGETYGVDIHRVREIIRVQEITRVPRTPDFVEGIINLRGRVIPVLDLRKRLNMSSDDTTDEARIVVIEQGDQTIGMIVDRVSQVLRIDQSVIEPPSPYIVSVETHYISGIAKVDNQLIVLLDLDQVLSEKEKEHLARISQEESREGNSSDE